MLDQLTGNQHVKDLLKRMLEARRVPGALLFSGEEGVGKKLFALELAKALNCRSPRGVEGCGACPACIRISKLHIPESEEWEDWLKILWTDHGDVGLVQSPKRVLRVEQMRLIEREANFRPFEGRARVFLIEDADKLNDASSNALLKVLEEPPPTSHIILLTSRPAVLLPTIRSRCQIVRFSPLTVAEIEDHLIRNKLAKPSEAKLQARCASGSLSRALKGDLTTYLEHRDTLLRVLTALAVTRDRSQLLRVAEVMNEARYKDDYEFRLELLETLIRDVLILVVKGNQDQLVNEDLLPELQKIAMGVDSDSATRWIWEIEELRDQLIVNINRKVATDALFLSMAESKRLIPRPTVRRV
jgi:DNA polymerase-3 subunit delta'